MHSECVMMLRYAIFAIKDTVRIQWQRMSLFSRGTSILLLDSPLLTNPQL